MDKFVQSYETVTSRSLIIIYLSPRKISLKISRQPNKKLSSRQMRFIININNMTAFKYKRMNHEEWKKQ